MHHDHRHHHHVRHPFLWIALGRYLSRFNLGTLFLALGPAVALTMGATLALGDGWGLALGTTAVLAAIVWWARR